MITATAVLAGTITATVQLVSRQTGSYLPATVHNSDDTFEEQVASGGDLELEDTTINVYVNGALNQTVVVPSMIDRTINIS